jgi:[ribosomal protein S5]-alanine N-acetyltransferase
VHVVTDRLTLRPFAAADGTALHGYLGLPEVVRFEPYGPCTPAEADAEALRREGDPRFVAVERTADGVLLGHVYRAPTGPEAWRTWTLGYVFHPAHGGAGYATEAARAVVDHCVRVEGAHRVVARCDPRNARSWRLLERLGMRREGHERRCASFRADADGAPVWHDAYLYAVLAEDWPAAARG